MFTDYKAITSTTSSRLPLTRDIHVCTPYVHVHVHVPLAALTKLGIWHCEGQRERRGETKEEKAVDSCAWGHCPSMVICKWPQPYTQLIVTTPYNGLSILYTHASMDVV